MSAVLRLLYDELRTANATFYRDPRITHLPLVGTPWQMVAVLTLYLLLITRWGPRFMNSRKPYNAKVPMQIYNALQVLLNLYICINSLRYSYLQPHFKFTCQRYDPLDMRESNLLLRYPAYVYYLTKYLDLLDTVFFVLRKNYRQITFLHLYHHTIMVYGAWVYITLLYASHYTATGVINSFIHVCMYAYYFVAALQLPVDLTPLKRLLTQMQIVQFCCLAVHFALPLVSNWCGLDLFWTWIVFVQNIFMLILFTDFYYKTYVRPKAKQHRTGSAGSPPTVSGHANRSEIVASGSPRKDVN